MEAVNELIDQQDLLLVGPGSGVTLVKRDKCAHSSAGKGVVVLDALSVVSRRCVPVTVAPRTYICAIVRDGKGGAASRALDFSLGYKNVGLAACIEGDADSVAQV